MNTVNYSRQTFQRWLVRALIPVAVTLLFWGCSGDPEATVVDFSRKVAVKQPGEQKSDSSILRVAVGAMISPRETATHYYALLGYIADKMGRDVELIQRRTYGQINELLAMEREIAIVHPIEKDGRRLGEILARTQYRIKVFVNLEELQTYLQTGPCKAVIIDMDELPVDRQLFRSLKRLQPKLNILVLSSRTFHPEFEEAMTRHIYACLNKPVDPEEMIFLLRGINNAA
jgi:hypothetical protein